MIAVNFRAGGAPWRFMLAMLVVGGPLTISGEQAPIPQAPAATPLVFDGVTVVDVEQGRLLPTQRVVIVGTRIQAMGPVRDVAAPAGAQVVDARGKYLIPGLWDLHMHPDRYADVFDPLLLANGVTGLRDASSPLPLEPSLALRRQILEGTRAGPPRQLFVGKALVEAGTGPCVRDDTDPHMCVVDAADGRHLIDSLKAAGADMIKFYFLDNDLYFPLAAEARRIGISFGGHLNTTGPLPWPVGPSVTEASDSGLSILDHMNAAGGLLDFCVTAAASEEKCQSLAERFRRNGTWWMPSVTITASHDNLGSWGGWERSVAVFDRLRARSGAYWAGTSTAANWLHDSAAVVPPGKDADGMMRWIRQADLPLLSGTDTGPGDVGVMAPGFSLQAELAMYVAEGLTPLQALRSATLNPAKLLHATDSLGTVAAGKLADLVLLDADPLADITNTTTIRGVVANGRYYDRTALDHLLAYARARAPAMGMRP